MFVTSCTQTHQTFQPPYPQIVIIPIDFQHFCDQHCSNTSNISVPIYNNNNKNSWFSTFVWPAVLAHIKMVKPQYTKTVMKPCDFQHFCDQQCSTGENACCFFMRALCADVFSSFSGTWDRHLRLSKYHKIAIKLIDFHHFVDQQCSDTSKCSTPNIQK